jgi:ribonuclease J
MEITENDTIIFSARPIPGNEGRIKEMMQRLLSKGAELVLPIELKGDPIFQFDEEGLIHYEVTHVSGHEGWAGSRKALELLRPEIVIPFHGPKNLRCELRDHIEQDLPEITVLMANESETITID